MEKNKYAAQERYEKKNGIVVKSFKIRRTLRDDFAEACNRVGVSQAAVISQLMQRFINEHKQD